MEPRSPPRNRTTDNKEGKKAQEYWKIKCIFVRWLLSFSIAINAYFGVSKGECKMEINLIYLPVTYEAQTLHFGCSSRLLNSSNTHVACLISFPIVCVGYVRDRDIYTNMCLIRW